MRQARAVAVAAMIAAWGCADPIEDPPPIDHRVHGLDAICQVDVDGAGIRDVETDYVAHVVACENGAADFQALKAQAVAARSYMYYKVETAGMIGDGQHDQVYTCGRPPRQEHFDAAEQTAGEVLIYQGVVVAAFYVAGAIPDPPDCVADADDSDPTNTERYVTYNQGRAGDALTQTPLGWVDPRNLRNRGCKSQNGANCLSRAGWDYRDIIHFYYGADITIEQAVGACVPEPDMGPEPDLGPELDMTPPDLGPEPDAGPPADEGVEPDLTPPLDMTVDPDTTPPDAGPLPCPTAGPAPAIVDQDSHCFELTCADGPGVRAVEGGFNGTMIVTPVVEGDTRDCDGRWRFGVSTPGDYTLWAYLPPAAEAASTAALYRIEHARGADFVPVDQTQSGWAALGTYAFAPDSPASVALGDATGEAFGPQIVFDAMRIEPAGGPTTDMGPPDGGPAVGRIADDDGCRATPGQGTGGAGVALLILLVGVSRQRR